MIDPTDPMQIIHFALEHAPDRVAFIEFAGLVEKRGIQIRTKKVPLGKGIPPAKVRMGQVRVNVPVPVAETLKAGPEHMDYLILVHVPRSVYNQAVSGIVLPPGVRM